MQVTSVSHPYNRVSFGAIALQKCMQKELSTVGKGFNKGVSEILQNFELPNKPVTKTLKGPYEIAKAKKYIAGFSVVNAGVGAAMAQAPGYDMVALGGVEFGMAGYIFNDIYGFSFSKSAIKGALTAIKGCFVGLTAFSLATKYLSWIPGPGNLLNAAVAGGTTAYLGSKLIDAAETIEQNKKRGKSFEEILKILKELSKKR